MSTFPPLYVGLLGGVIGAGVTGALMYEANSGGDSGCPRGQSCQASPPGGGGGGAKATCPTILERVATIDAIASGVDMLAKDGAPVDAGVGYQDACVKALFGGPSQADYVGAMPVACAGYTNAVPDVTDTCYVLDLFGTQPQRDQQAARFATSS